MLNVAIEVAAEPKVTISPYPPFADKTVRGLCVNLYPPDTLTVPVTANVLPSKVRLDSTVPLGAEPLSVIRPLSVVPVKDNKPLVPEVPFAPFTTQDNEYNVLLVKEPFETTGATPISK